ncbi:septal ring lytic transglycosylase RlpA family protein [Neiella sp. HB171785]|uniref:Endolytic peptidoglycan transglycosylase RlpA n=1 Tax=Neiella litorisoli TaxID=2771431 RepID=A0A8J6QJ09_9GAMM|nr:septal ring lytic transglycosylase RlpA family protein [Neiella litorisoli]MBD1389768.1 septal ring lytic transglycosylase RlpA family protein [Neiella litorisoli]
MSELSKVAGLLTALALLSGCASSGMSKSDRYQAQRYHQADDSAPVDPVDVSQVPDAVPKYEPKSRGGNRHYTVRGKHYQVMDSAEGFSETGKASWYGNKFHGHKTSNGEIYNMYAMSAAHKHLPLPSFVKVTRLDNGKQVIVRVNDRGPFHRGRIIDLSYAAAHKLGMLKTGTAAVKIEAIAVEPPWQQPDPIMALVQQQQSEGPKLPIQVAASSQPTVATPANQTSDTNISHRNWFVQVAATQDKARADHLIQQLASLFDAQGRTVSEQKLHKIQLGPFADEQDANKLLEILKKGEFSSAFKVYH